MISYSTNKDTSTVVSELAVRSVSSLTSVDGPSPGANLRILLETDAPYMVPGNLYNSLPSLSKGAKIPLCHSAMIPWTADFVAGVAGPGWDAERVMREARENARKVYGV